MTATGHLWSILLAAGDGNRVRSLTDVNGEPVPKQFCRFGREESMLRWTINRAAMLVSKERIVTVVAARHRRWWDGELADLPPSNVVVQPLNKGTAAGILLPLLHVRRLDPMARVVIFPTDHHVADETVLRNAIVDATDEVYRHRDRLVVVGTSPSEVDTECGWIVPMAGDGDSSAQRVTAFVEKPDPDTTRRLTRRGAVVNTFIMVGTVDGMLRLFAREVPKLLERFVLTDTAVSGGLDDLYRTLPSVDFSREILENSCDSLSVVRAGGCGWMDLGTPARVTAFLGDAQGGLLTQHERTGP